MSINDVKKRGRGRPRKPTEPLTVRIPPNLLAAIDIWRKRQPGKTPTRPDGIRHFIELSMLDRGELDALTHPEWNVETKNEPSPAASAKRRTSDGED